ncbi:hypothetical protein CS8_022150 [Cupriavidus sp. 8B]
MIVVAEVRESPSASAAREKLFISTTRVKTSMAWTLSIVLPFLSAPRGTCSLFRGGLFGDAKLCSGL